MRRGLLTHFCSPPLLGFLLATALIHFFLPALLLQLLAAIVEDGITM
jgi:hypothetical protein